MNLFFPIALISLTVPSINVPVSIPNDFTYIEVPPIGYYGEITIKVKGAFTGRFERYCCIEIFNYIYPNGKEIYRENSSFGSYDFSFNYSNTFTTPDIIFKFRESRSGKSVEISPKFIETPIIDLTDPDRKTSYSNIVVYTHDDGINLINEEYLFEGFNSLYIPDYYHKLDLSTFKIKVGNDSIDSFGYTNAMFYIYDPNVLFEEFASYKSGEYVLIPLEFLKNDNGYYNLKTKNTLYVNPLTLRMSLAYKKDYVKTRHIYFPINQRKNEDTFRFGLTINDLGYNKAYISHTFKVKTYKNIIGDCKNSQYCIGFSISNGNGS